MSRKSLSYCIAKRIAYGEKYFTEKFIVEAFVIILHYNRLRTAVYLDITSTNMRLTQDLQDLLGQIVELHLWIIKLIQLCVACSGITLLLAFTQVLNTKKH